MLAVKTFVAYSIARASFPRIYEAEATLNRRDWSSLERIGLSHCPKVAFFKRFIRMFGILIQAL